MPAQSRRSIRKDKIRVELLVVPPLGNNVYIVFEDGSDTALIVDVAQGAEAIVERCNKLAIRPSLIVNTHGHSDHTFEDDLLKRSTGAKIAIHELDAYRLATDDEASRELGVLKMPIEPDVQLTSGQLLPLGDTTLDVISTPGHTEGSICLYEKKAGLLFSGDTLFARGFGRVDGRGGDIDAMSKSLKRLLQLPGQTDVLPGHGDLTKIENEQWLKDLF